MKWTLPSQLSYWIKPYWDCPVIRSVCLLSSAVFSPQRRLSQGCLNLGRTDKSRDSLALLNWSGHAVKALWHRLPLFGHFHHAASVQDPVAKQVVELQSHAVPPPLVDLIMQLVPLRGQDWQVLHVPPRQVGAGVQATKWATKGRSRGGVNKNLLNT